MKRFLVAKLFFACLSVCLLIVCSAATGARAQVKPGDVITPQNADLVKNLLPPGTLYSVQHGMRMNITVTRRVDWPPPYKEATEKYAAQVRLSSDHRSLVGYVAGQPFPLLDANDPHIATKIMWNNVFRPIGSDDYDLRFFDCEHQYIRPGKGQFQIEYTNIGHYAGYSLVGRTEVEPLPTDPDFKVTGRIWLFALYPILAPAKGRGGGFVRWRYADPNRDDDIWSYEPSTRRVRRLNSAIMSASVSQDVMTTNFDPDHYSGFNAKTEFYNYKYLGEKEMLACINGAHSPEITCPYDGGASVCPENWEMRHLYIVEATPRRGAGARTILQGKSIVYVDSEMWFFSGVDTYDQRGELYQISIFYLTNRDRPVPDAKVAIYPFKRTFVTAHARIDTQSGFSDVCYLPGRNVPERECWYINMGAVDREFFTTQAMVKAGH